MSWWPLQAERLKSKGAGPLGRGIGPENLDCQGILASCSMYLRTSWYRAWPSKSLANESHTKMNSWLMRWCGWLCRGEYEKEGPSALEEYRASWNGWVMFALKKKFMAYLVLRGRKYANRLIFSARLKAERCFRLLLSARIARGNSWCSQFIHKDILYKLDDVFHSRAISE